MEKYFDSLEPITVLNRDGIEKTAEEKKKQVDSQIMDFIKGIKPDKDKEIYAYVLAMGDDRWGSNSNSDLFPYDQLNPHDTNEYGHETFLKAGLYNHHKNKNPKLSLGNIVMSIFNPIMHRVELIKRVDRQLCKERDTCNIYDRLLDGELIPTSIGCRVSHDSCSVCHNKAKNKTEYCDHIKNSLGKIMPNGIKVMMINVRPVFFDDSFVTNPAFKPASVISILEEKDGKNCLNGICVVQVPKEFPSRPQKEEKVESTTEKTAQEKVTTKKHKPTKVVRQIKYRELPISIEVMSQDYRTGYSKGGMWKKKMHVHYGFINKTEGDDGEEVDVYLKPEANKTGDVYVVKQMKNKDGIRSFDEDKVMLGFDSLHHAKSVYLQHMPEKCFGSIEKYTYQDFLTKYLPKYKDKLEKEAQHIIKEAFCHCGSDCCKIAAKKESSNKEADIIKRVPALMTKIPQELLSKIQNKKLCN